MIFTLLCPRKIDTSSSATPRCNSSTAKVCRKRLGLGFAAGRGFRRSELAGSVMEDQKDTPEGMLAMLRKSKTDQEGQGRPVALPYGSDPLTCPVRALKAWTEMAGIRSGPLFRGVDPFGLVSERALRSDSVAWVVKWAAGRTGLEAMEYSGHKPARRPRHPCRHERCRRTGHHETDWGIGRWQPYGSTSTTARFSAPTPLRNLGCDPQGPAATWFPRLPLENRQLSLPSAGAGRTQYSHKIRLQRLILTLRNPKRGSAIIPACIRVRPSAEQYSNIRDAAR